MKTALINYFTLLLTCFKFLKAAELIVTVETGTIVGMTNMSQNGTDYYSYLGIPYAAPPTEDLRFRAPAPATNWSGVLEAFYETPSCSTGGGGSEDCLYLNVFAPADASGNAVLVWIYGGAYNGGSNTIEKLGPDFYMEHGVVMVAPNYRTGAVGLLSLQNEDIPGNAGLKDMVAALQWTQRNIAAFGGDPNKVTFGGHSSGSSSVAHLFISPATKGLYRSAIIMSGQATAPWAIEPNPREKALMLAEAMGFEGGNDTELAQFLRSVDHTELTRDNNRVLTEFEQRRLSALAWAPVIEPESDTAVIWESPARILSEGRFNQVPVLTGFTSADGSINAQDIVEDTAWMADLHENFTDLVGSQLLLPTQDERDEAALKTDVFYFGELGLTDLLPQAFYDLCSDMMWIESTSSFVKTVAALSSSPAYYYYFAYNGTGATEYGVPHGAELKYLVIRSGGMPNQDPESTDGKVKDLMTTTWSNFIKFGEPAPGGYPVLWEPYTPDVHNYLDITDEFVQKQNPLKIRMDFWATNLPFVEPMKAAGPTSASGSITLIGLALLFVFTSRMNE